MLVQLADGTKARRMFGGQAIVGWLSPAKARKVRDALSRFLGDA